MGSEQKVGSLVEFTSPSFFSNWIHCFLYLVELPGS